MRFLTAWTELGTGALILILLAPALLGLAAFLPGRAIARLTAAGVALGVLALGGVGIDAALRLGWSILWGVVAWRAGRPRPAGPGQARRPGGAESGMIGLLLALALLALLVAAVARHDLDADAARRASYGLALLVLGLLHLMLRRDALRALLAFGALGLGLEVLEGAARDLLLPSDARVHSGVALLATAVAVALTDRVVRTRQHSAGTPWVSDAHDLHD